MHGKDIMKNVEYDFSEFAAKQAEKDNSSSQGNGSCSKVRYFNALKNDGDEVIVRLNYTGVNDFKVVPCHRFKVENRWMNVACLRNLYETKEGSNCPLCKTKNSDDYPVKSKTFLQMIVYARDEKGNLTVEPVVWERPAAAVNDFIGALNDGVSNLFFPKDTDLHDVIFKVRRSGAAGSRETKYIVTAGNPMAYPEDVYKKDFSGFKGFDSTKFGYFVKTPEEMEYFLQTGSFKKAEKKADDNGVVTMEQSAPAAPAAPVAQAAPARQVTADTSVAEMALAEGPAWVSDDLPFNPYPEEPAESKQAAPAPANPRRTIPL